MKWITRSLTGFLSAFLLLSATGCNSGTPRRDSPDVPSSAETPPAPESPSDERNAMPPRALYNNDGLGGGIQQQRQWGGKLGPESGIDDCLRAAIDEMAGLGAHLLAPGDGWVVWWQSREYPMEEHARWLQDMGYESATLRVPGEQPSYILDGGDLVQDLVDHCRRVGVPPFVTFRMNDYHWNELLWLPETLWRREVFGEGGWPLARISRFLVEHWDHRIGPGSDSFLAAKAANDEEKMLAIVREPQQRWRLRHGGVLDWAHPPVREHKLAFMRELAAYDIDGIELDFMRHCRFFKDDFPIEDRIAIMTDFVRDVRRALDEAAPDGQRRILIARVPSRLIQMPELGIDLEAFVEAGLDYVNLSQYFMSTQDSDLAEVVRMLPGVPVYLEMTQGALRQDGVWRLVTPEQLATAAHVTYARGGTGLSYFNIQYYRAGRDQASRDGIRVDIPFETMRTVTDPAQAARLPQHYFIGPGNNLPRVEGARQMPQTLGQLSSVRVRMDCAPPAGGWQSNGRLRVEGVEPWGDRQVALTINGEPCAPTDDVSEPFPGPYHNPESMADPDHLRAWVVPPEVLIDGKNDIRIVLENGESIRIQFVDLAFPEEA